MRDGCHWYKVLLVLRFAVLISRLAIWSTTWPIPFPQRKIGMNEIKFGGYTKQNFS